jgi:hypothetical protein
MGRSDAKSWEHRFMWSELLDLAMQDATIELAAAFVLVTASGSNLTLGALV